MPRSSRRDPPATAASASPLADAVTALETATASMPGSPAPRASSEATPRPSGSSAEDPHEQYYRQLEERGVLKDVDEGADLSSLPSAVTHVRYPDGRVERLGYS